MRSHLLREKRPDAERHRPQGGPAPGLLVRSLAAGLLVGPTVSLLFACLLWEPNLRPVFRAVLGRSRVDVGLPITVVAVTVLAALAAGATFARLVLAYRGQRPGFRRPSVVAVAFLLASVAGVFLAGSLEPVGVALPDAQRLVVFRVAFVGASALVALLSTAIAGWTLGLRHALPRALAVTALTAATYLAIAVAVDPLPGWHVGGGDRAMLKVATVGNLIAGLVGGATAFALLARAPQPGRR